MVRYDQWVTPSYNQYWDTCTLEDIYGTKHFILNIFLDDSGRVDKKKLEEIPEGTTSIKIERNLQIRGSDRSLYFDKGYIPSSVTRVSIEYQFYMEIGGSDGWLPDSVTMLSVPSLPFPTGLVPKNIRYLKVQYQKEAIEIDMVPPTTDDGFDDEFNNNLRDLNIQSIISLKPVAPLPTITSLVIDEDGYSNFNLEAVHPLPPQLKYLSLPYTYDQPIYQQHIPISLTHLELYVIIDQNNHFTNDWLCSKGYLPPSITHLKINFYFEGDDRDINDNVRIETKEEEEINVDKEFNNDQDDKIIDNNNNHPFKKIKIDQNGGDQDLLLTKQDEDNEEVYFPLPSSLKILIPSSIQSVCFSFNNKSSISLALKCGTVLDKDDYYSTTPTPPKIRQGLKELVLPESFNYHIHNSTLPSTLQSLSINNPHYNNPLNSNNLPLSLTSFKCNSINFKLDLSLFESIKELKVYADGITHYPPNVEALELRSPYLERGFQFKFNKNLIKSLVYSSHPGNPTYERGLFNELINTLPNVQYLSSESLDFKVPASVKELKCLDPFFINTDVPLISSLPLETLHLDLGYYLKNHLPTQDNHQRCEKIINSHIPNQQPMLDTFFKIWRNIYLKPLVLEALYDLTKSLLRFDSETGTLEHIDKFKQYKILVDDRTQLGPALLKFDKADEIYIFNGTNTNLSSFISKSIKKLRCNFTKGIPDWITHLNLGDIRLSDHEVVEIPPSVTNLTIDTNDEKYIGKIPSTVRYLTLKKLKNNLSHCIPPSVTHLYLANTAFNSINKTDIPSTVQRIEFKKLLYQKDKGEYDIPSFISSRLVNGVFYICSKSKNRITIPSNTTHLFWLDDQYIDNDYNGINIPPSVHTLVLDETFNSAILSLPPTITQMIFQGFFQQPLGSISFPPALKYLSIHQFYNDIQEQYLPNGLTHLSFGTIYKIISLPQSVNHLEFISISNFPLRPMVKHVRFQSSDQQITIKSFNSPDRYIRFKKFTDKPVSSLNSDSTSVHLYSCKRFNSFIVPHTLGNNIKSITFGDSFNQVLLKGAIPNSVEKLVFGEIFNHKLNKSILPTSLMTLVLGSDFNQDLNDNLPSSLTELMLNTKSKPSFTSSSHFPSNLKKLILPYYDGVLDIIPTTINHLEFNISIDTIIFPIELVPPHITTLVLNDSMRIQSYHLIPASITCITLCDSITPYTKIPCTVESVVLPKSFNQPLDTILPTVDDQ
ncbi:hypothetical protein CYY_009510 [Polysphondylium violaceum]|uniref:FNIP repeat-containing protein n=1 Tax=Polysphondylium violaceum TaxID=133409 RepID=A0A8J4PLE1_9MYCE|nr:hypothetical protein CYY_009510 [Polysphondylium violaceum]